MPPTEPPREPEAPKILVGHVDGDPSALPEGIVYAPSRDSDAPVRIDRQARRIDDPAEIGRCRAAYERSLDAAFENAMGRAKAGEPLYSDDRAALSARRERALAALRGIAADADVGPAGRMGAANALRSLGEPQGEALLLEGLWSPSPRMREAAIKTIRRQVREIALDGRALAERLVALMEDSDPAVAEAAVELCVFRRIDGAEGQLMRLLGREDAGDKGALALKLAEVASTPAAMQALLPHLLRDGAEQYNWFNGYVLRRAIAHPDSGVAEPVRRRLREYVLSFKGKQRYDQHLAEDLAAVADAATLPALADVYEHAKDPVSRWRALGAMARLQPERALDVILEAIRKDGPNELLLDALRGYVGPGDAERVLPLLLPPAEQTERPRRELDEKLASLLLEKLGPAGGRAAEAHLDEFEPYARQWALWKLRGLDLRSALSELRIAGIIEAEPEQVLEQIRARREARAEAEDDESPPTPLETSDPSGIFTVLGFAGLITAFDVETSMVPCDHDQLILEFAAGSGGRFAPECPVQFWHQRDEEDYDAPYTVQFIFNSRLYRFGAENYGDWYDVQAVQEALNFALADNGMRQRYIALESGGQVAQFVFADPAVFEPFARRYALPLSGDPTQAMRKGIEYERYVAGESA
jgi:HEAT repeat protein